MSNSPSVHLKRFTSSDIPELVSWVPDVRFLLQFSGPSYSFASFAQQLQNDLQQMETTDEKRLYKAVVGAEQRSVGHLQFITIDQAKKSAWLGRILVGDPAARGKGYGEAMVTTALDIAFGELALHEVGLSVYDFNHAAVRCYGKLGFQEYERETVYQAKACEEWTTIRMKLRREP